MLQMTDPLFLVAPDTAGNDYIAGQQFTVSGTALGGTSPTNDALITIVQPNPKCG